MKTGTALDKMARKGISELKPLIEKTFFFFFNSCFHFNPAKIFKILLFSFGSHTALIPHVHLCATSNAVSAGECLSGNTIA